MRGAGRRGLKREVSDQGGENSYLHGLRTLQEAPPCHPQAGAPHADSISPRPMAEPGGGNDGGSSLMPRTSHRWRSGDHGCECADGSRGHRRGAPRSGQFATASPPCSRSPWLAGLYGSNGARGYVAPCGWNTVGGHAFRCFGQAVLRLRRAQQEVASGLRAQRQIIHGRIYHGGTKAMPMAGRHRVLVHLRRPVLNFSVRQTCDQGTGCATANCLGDERTGLGEHPKIFLLPP